MVETAASTTPSLEEVRQRLSSQSGPTYWRSLEDLAGREDVDQLVHREFPNHVTDLLDPVSRRNFVKLMGASLMLAGLANCSRQPQERIVPFVHQPEQMIQGKPAFFATAMPYHGRALGVLASSFEGRPTKLEGLPEHPATLGASNVHLQAEILQMYDPDRLDTVLHGSDISTWPRFVSAIMHDLLTLNAEAEGLYILSETVTSPSFGAQMARLRQRFPKVQWRQWEPASGNAARVAALQSFGQAVDAVYNFREAQVILSLDADFLMEGPAQIRYARDFADGRDVDTTGGTMSRLYVAESTPSVTGANADHKLSLRYPDIELLARGIAARLGVAGASEEAGASIPEAWLNAVVEDLRAAGARALVVPGDKQTPAVHLIAHAINNALGSTAQGGVITYIPSVEVEAVDQTASLLRLLEEMNAGAVKMLVILEGNPAYNKPGDVDFAAAVKNVPLCVHLTQHANETSNFCHWVVPAAHFLEGWGDLRAHDGTVSLVQPLIHPLYGGRSAIELLDVLLGNENPDGMQIVKETWRAQFNGGDFETFWKVALSRGMIQDSASKPAPVQFAGKIPAADTVPQNHIDILFRTGPSVLDGRYANNGWLQEMPMPLTLLTWDNAVFIHPSTATKLSLEHADIVQLDYNGRSVTAPVMIQFGHPKDAITVHLGYGRKRAGRVGNGVGFDAYALQTSDSPWFGTGASLSKTGSGYLLAHTGDHAKMEQTIVLQGQKAEDRHLIREATLEHWREHPDFALHMAHKPLPEHTLYQPGELPYTKEHDELMPGDPGNSWAMTIDLNRCIGCKACMVACYAENNIAVVGKTEVSRGREMAWIRIDRYYKGDFEGEPEVAFQPIPCMQCENAPCEPVCPVAATVHNNEGLNDMVYNRCIGTRYCSNNCPYKVRRFNFFKYSDHSTPQLKMMRNPNVTVRSRGVMEKCTYCVQRISIARIDAKREGRPIADGEVVTACQSACPTRAIMFGNVNDPESRISKMKANTRNYGLLEDINTRPRTTYLAQLRNPSPALAAPETHHETQTEH